LVDITSEGSLLLGTDLGVISGLLSSERLIDSVVVFSGGESMPINLAMTLGLFWPSFALKEMSSWISFLIGVELWLSPDFGYCLILQEYC
jgi:hypothetical protein